MLNKLSVIIEKLQKRASTTILLRRVRQSSELKKMRSYHNDTLLKVVDAFLEAKKGKYSQEEWAAFNDIEAYRQRLLNDSTLISYEVFDSEQKVPVSEIARKAASSVIWCHLLYSVTKHLQSENVLEIGTNVGISGSYLLESLKQHKPFNFVTMEGLPQLCEISAKQFSSITEKNSFTIVQGLYDHTFSSVLQKDLPFDTLFIDGNHKKKPTLDYFNALKGKTSNPSVFIFDDIMWSEEMKETWQIIKNDDYVTYYIDLYKQGIVIVDRNDRNSNIPFELHLAY
ncbi:MAG: class I SAM-dependent methyltransferase [Cyclobacteriaceae bacterium]